MSGGPWGRALRGDAFRAARELAAAAMGSRLSDEAGLAVSSGDQQCAAPRRYWVSRSAAASSA